MFDIREMIKKCFLHSKLQTCFYLFHFLKRVTSNHVQGSTHQVRWCLWVHLSQPPVSSEKTALWLLDKMFILSGALAVSLFPAALQPMRATGFPVLLYQASIALRQYFSAASRIVLKLSPESRSELDVRKIL